MRGSHSAGGRGEREGWWEVGRECGNKDRGKMERGSFAQPSITFLGFKFIWLHFLFIFYQKHSTQRGRGAGREGENEGKMEGEKSMGKEEEGKAGGGGGTSEGMKKKAVRVILSIGFNAHFLFVSRAVVAKGGSFGCSKHVIVSLS